MNSVCSSVATAGLVLLVACADGGADSNDDGAGTQADDTAGTESASVGTDGSASASVSASASASASATEADTGTSSGRPDYVQDIAPLIATHCASCHTEGGIAPFSLATYEDASTWATPSAAQVQMGLMPPWHGVETDECTPPLPFKHDARLSQDEIDLFLAWNQAGAPQGDPAEAVPLPEPMDLDLADPSETTTMTSAIEIPAAGGPTLDYFHCLSFDPGHDTDVYVDGLQVVPGNRGVVHHVLMFVDEQADSADWDGGVLEDCGGASGVGGATLVGGWVPGSLPIETPEDVAIRLPVGARIIFNMHYHNATESAQIDEGTGVALRWSTTLPRYIGTFQLVGAPGAGDLMDAPFMIPAGASGHVERLQFEVPDLGVPEIRVFSMTNHMHKVGVDMKVTMSRGGDETCMLQTPRWDFNWQRQYAYDAPIDELPEVLPGDVVEVRCTYDNVITNPGVAEALAELGLDAPQDVHLGESTLDEMCLAGVGIAVRPF